MNFPGSCVAGVEKPETTEFEQLLLGGKAVAITISNNNLKQTVALNDAVRYSNWNRVFGFHLPVLSKPENEDCSCPWYTTCCV